MWYQDTTGTARFLTVSLIIFGLFIVRSLDIFTLFCSCYAPDGEQFATCANFARDAVMTAGFSTMAAGATLPALGLIAAGKKGLGTEISK